MEIQFGWCVSIQRLPLMEINGKEGKHEISQDTKKGRKRG